jgi:RHS repeat-associated protein
MKINFSLRTTTLHLPFLVSFLLITLHLVSPALAFDFSVGCYVNNPSGGCFGAMNLNSTCAVNAGGKITITDNTYSAKSLQCGWGETNGCSLVLSSGYEASQGNHNFVATCTNQKDPGPPSLTASMSADWNPHNVVFSEPAANVWGMFNVVGSMDLPYHLTGNEWLNITVNNFSVSNKYCYSSPCTFNVQNIVKNQGNYTVGVAVKNAFINTTITTQVAVDRTPTLMIFDPVQLATLDSDIIVTAGFSPTTEATKGTVTIYVDGRLVSNTNCTTQSCTLTLGIPTLLSGQHTIVATATSGGATTSSTRTFTIDQILESLLARGNCRDNACRSANDPNVTTNSAVNVITGNVSHDQVLFSSVGLPLAAELSLFYTSVDQLYVDPGHGSLHTYKLPLGQGWSHSYDIALFKNPNNDMVLRGSKEFRFYTPGSGNTYTSRSYDSNVLAKNGDGSFTLTQRDGLRYNFSAAGILTSIVDRWNNTVTISAIVNHVKTVTDPHGRVIQFNYDSLDERVLSIVDPTGQVYNLSYNGDGMLTQVQYPAPTAGADRPTWTYAYTPARLLMSKSDPNGNVVAYDYDSYHRGTIATDPNQRSRSTAYGTGTTTFTEKNGAVWSYQFDSTKNIITSKTDPTGAKQMFTYDINGRLATETTPIDSSSSYLVTYGRDAYGNIIDVQGQKATYTFDANGNIISTTLDPVTSHIGYTYDYASYDDLTSVTNYMDSPTTTTMLVYDTNGGYRRVTVTDPEGQQKVIRYEATNQVHDVTIPGAGTTTYAYNANKTLLSVTAPDGSRTEFADYRSDGQPGTVKLYDNQNTLKQTKSITYDALGRATTSTDSGSAGYLTQFGYDKGDNLTSVTDAENHITQYQYTYRGQVKAITDALGKNTRIEFGAPNCPTCGNDQITALTDANSNRSTWSYDPVGRLAKETDPLNHAIRYDYYASGLPWHKIDDATSQNIATYSYDAMGHLTGVAYLDGTSETYSYYPDSLMQTAGNQNISYTFEWFKNGQLKKSTDSSNRTVEYTYNAAGQRATVTLLGGTLDQKVITYGYDASGRLQTIYEAGVGTFTIGYDNLGRRSTLTYPNGIVGTYSYHPDQPGWLSDITYAGSQTVAEAAYPSFDKVGNRTAKTIDGTGFSYLYDSVYQLLSSSGGSTESYTYDDAGNRLTEAGQLYTIGAANQLLAKPGKSYSYDNFGNTLTDGEWVYGWNSKNQLVSMTKAGTTATFNYDPFGRRLDKTVTVSGVTTAHDYVYDGEDIALEYINGQLANHFIHGPGTDEHLALVQGGNTFSYHADGLGSTTKITDDSQNVVQSYGYDSFGRLTSSVGNIDQPYHFTGREYDMETGKYYYRARYYDADSGRFLSRDPLGFGGGDMVLDNYVGSVRKPIQFSANLYHYTFNNPINLKDPSGLDPHGRDGRINLLTKCHVEPTKKELADLATMTALVGITGVFGEDLLWYTLMNPQKALDFVQSALPSSTPEPNGPGFLGSQFGSKFQYYLENRR